MWHGQQAFKVWLLVVCFNQSLDNVTWPACLQSLTFGDRNLQSLQVFDVLPGALGHLAIGEMSMKCWAASATLSPSTFKQKAAEKKAADRVFNDDDADDDDDDDDDDYRISFPLNSAKQKKQK